MMIWTPAVLQLWPSASPQECKGIVTRQGCGRVHLLSGQAMTARHTAAVTKILAETLLELERESIPELMRKMLAARPYFTDYIAIA